MPAQYIRMDYLGRGCWTISAFKTDTIDLCMEVQYARTDVGAPLTQYKYINGNKLISGATILGDGEVALILDVNTLL